MYYRIETREGWKRKVVGTRMGVQDQDLVELNIE